MVDSGLGFCFIHFATKRETMSEIISSIERGFLLDGLDLLAALFAGPGSDCPELVSKRIPAFASELAKAPAELEPVFERLLDAWTPKEPEVFCAEMESEYVRIFINTKGGVAAPLYHSVYRQGSEGLMGPPAREMAFRLASRGLDLESAGEPPDHLCVEIEYLMSLLAAGNFSGAAEFAGFMRQWAPDFRKAVLGAEPPVAYALAAEALEAVIERLAYSHPARPLLSSQP
jgi:TorA-specific chaperone